MENILNYFQIDGLTVLVIVTVILLAVAVTVICLICARSKSIKSTYAAYAALELFFLSAAIFTFLLGNIYTGAAVLLPITIILTYAAKFLNSPKIKRGNSRMQDKNK